MHPAHLTDCEARLLGVLLNHPAASCAAERAFDLPAPCIGDGRHRAIYEAAQTLYRAERPIEVLTLVDALKTADHLDQAGGYAYLAQLAAEPGFFANIRTYLADLKTAGQARERMAVGKELAAADFSADADEIAQQAARRLMDPAYRTDADDELDGEALAELAAITYDNAAQLAESGRRFVGLDCGFDRLNDKLNGLCPGELTVVAARPSIGKTTLAQQIALEVALREGKRVAFFSLEMTKAQIASRFACLLADVNPEAHRKGRLPPDEHVRFSEALSKLARLPITTYHQDRDSAAIDARVRSLKADPPALVVVDHLHRLAEPGRDSDHEKLGTAAHRLASLAVEADTHVVLLSQLNRQCEERPDKRPQLADLRGSGSIEEHAVNVVLIYRPGHYEDLRERSADPDTLVREVLLLCEKTRLATVGPVAAAWEPDLASFREAPAIDYHRTAPPYNGRYGRETEEVY